MLSLSVGQRPSQYGWLLYARSCWHASRFGGYHPRHLSYQTHIKRQQLTLGQATHLRRQEVRVQESSFKEETVTVYRVRTE